MAHSNGHNDDGRLPIVVTIGHNDANGVPLGLRRVHDFQRTITGVLDSVGFLPFFHGAGTGTWDGRTEGTTVWAGTLPAASLPLLRHNLAVQAAFFSQDSIGLIVHTDETQPSYVSAAA